MKVRVAVVLVFSSAFSGMAYGQQEVTLGDVVAMSIEQNYDVLLARNNSEAASTDNSYAWAAFMPTLNATASQTWTTSQQKVLFTDISKNNSGTAQSTNASGAVQLSWVLFDGTKMFATRERIAVLAEQGQLLVKDQMTNTIAMVTNSYYDIVRQKQQLKAFKEQMSVNEERVKLADRRLNVGTGSKPELLQARVDYNALRTQVIQQESVIAQLKEQLNGLLGLKLPTPYDVADTIVIDLEIQQPDENVEGKNFSLLATRRNMEIAALQLRERKAELLPTLAFNSAYNFSRNDNTKLINAFNAIFSQSNGFNYGFGLNVPIFNGFTTRRLIQQARITYSRQELIYNQLKANVDVGLRNAYVNYDNAKKILVVEEETILLAKENVFIALESFKRSVATFIELRTAQQSLADAYNRLITARYNAKVAETELLRLNGALIR
jgi:outer membrane protein TolC